MEISKSAVLFKNEHLSDKKKYYKRFSYTFSLCNRSHKNDCHWNARECCIKEDINQNGSLIIS